MCSEEKYNNGVKFFPLRLIFCSPTIRLLPERQSLQVCAGRLHSSNSVDVLSFCLLLGSDTETATKRHSVVCKFLLTKHLVDKFRGGEFLFLTSDHFVRKAEQFSFEKKSNLLKNFRALVRKSEFRNREKVAVENTSHTYTAIERRKINALNYYLHL